jgi:4-hydroxy-3-polyprenylbenzoate decarboxylase
MPPSNISASWGTLHSYLNRMPLGNNDLTRHYVASERHGPLKHTRAFVDGAMSPPKVLNQRSKLTEFKRQRIVVAVTGATGAPLAVSVLGYLRKIGVETHLIMSTWGSSTLKYELNAPKNTPQYIRSLADYDYSPKDVSASLSSGSFRTHGMIVVPCSMKTLAGIRIGYDTDLITRAASVTLKERRKLVLVARETPLSSIHLENMLEVTRAGATVFPPVMAFYTRPKSVEEMVDQSVRRMVDALDLDIAEHDVAEGRWNGFDWDSLKDAR